MRLIGPNRASAPWFLNRAFYANLSRRWTSETVIPASSPLSKSIAFRPDNFVPLRRPEKGYRHEYQVDGHYTKRPFHHSMWE